MDQETVKGLLLQMWFVIITLMLFVSFGFWAGFAAAAVASFILLVMQ